MGVGTWEPRVGGLTTQPGGGGPGLPTWVKLGLVLASGIRGWVLASWVRPGWAWGSGGELVGCSPAPGLGPACAQPAAPPVYGCGRARRTLEASRVTGPVEEEMATCCSILAWRIPWTEEPGALQRVAKTEMTDRLNMCMQGHFSHSAIRHKGS